MNTASGATIGLIELPLPHVIDAEGRNWSTPRRDTPLISKQILMASLNAEGFSPHLLNMKWGEVEHTYGRVLWNDRELIKFMKGDDPFALNPLAFDVWGITVNLCIQREIALLVIKHLIQGGKPVVVGGSDAIAQPQSYLQAGAAAIVLDKSGGANGAILRAVLGEIPKTDIKGALFPESKAPPQRAPTMKIESWPMPSVDMARQCFGGQEFRKVFPKHLKPMGSIMPDFGCDRTCDFCQTPSYKLGFKAMTPHKTLSWIALQKEAGARSVNIYSDQFLARVLRPGGRQDVLTIMNGAKEMNIATLFSNGLELAKMTRGLGRHSDQTSLKPDQELVEALCGWDGEVGCSYLYVAGERPLFGRDGYDKLLPWQAHCAMMRAIVRSGIPYIGYGVIIGFEDDCHESLSHLEKHLIILRDQLLDINPDLHFSLEPYALIIIPGTPQDRLIREKGLLQFDDPTLYGGFWTPSINTHKLSYRHISEWQQRLVTISTEATRAEYAFIDPSKDASP
ncbi:radical SAM protein [Magnetococcales bacterium HHB-1]